MADQDSHPWLPEPPPTTANCPPATLGLSPLPPFPPAPPRNAPMPVPEQVGTDIVRRTPECAIRPDDPCARAPVPCCAVAGTVPADCATLEPPPAHATTPAASPAEQRSVRTERNRMETSGEETACVSVFSGCFAGTLDGCATPALPPGFRKPRR